MDRHAPTASCDLEPGPEHARDPQQWLQCALRETWARALFYGQEHYPPQAEAARALLRMHAQSGHVWPAHVIYGIWAELRWQWCEELRALHRQVLGELNGEEPGRERIRFLCTSPRSPGDRAPWLQLPRTFFLDDPDQYFAKVVKPRRWAELGRPGQYQIAPRVPQLPAGPEDSVEDLKQLIREIADAIPAATEAAVRREHEQREELAELRRRREEISARSRELMPRLRDVQLRFAAVLLQREAFARETEVDDELPATRPEPPPGIAGGSR